MPKTKTEKRKVATDIQLPEGVSLAEWSLEKMRWQNPRIRAFLGCIRALDEVFESNYAILHCSPRRLAEIWGQVCKISHILRVELAPLLKGTSRIPDLEQARESAQLYLSILDKNLLKELDRLPENLEESHYPEVRKLLCVAIGQLHAFLLDTLGEMLAKDPRSQNDADYFLTRRFTRDVDEAEWLHTSVIRLDKYLEKFSRTTANRLSNISQRMMSEKRVPSPDEWGVVTIYIDEVIEDLVGRLKMILGLRGIRLSELELLDRHAGELPSICKTLRELYESATITISSIRDAPAEQQGGDEHEAAIRVVNQVFSDRMLTLINSIQDEIRDLTTYLPVWRQCIENRRAMMLKKKHDHEV
jgi:hypothetical protein